MAKKYLNVAYEDRDLAKRLGARWDPSVKKWYCTAGSPLATVFSWRKQAKGTSEIVTTNAPKPQPQTQRYTPPAPRPNPSVMELPLFG